VGVRIVNCTSKFYGFIKKIKNKTHKTLKSVGKVNLNRDSSLEASASSNSVLDPLTQKTYSRSENMSLEMLEDVYYNVVLKQNFYDQDYGLNWHIEPYEKLAEVLTAIFSPKHHIDIGCGLGLLVTAMINLGVNSYGIDFSESLINQADENFKKYLTVATAEDWIQKASINKVDLLTFTEVFEHLPVSILEQILKRLHQYYLGKIFLTIPSFGFDSIFKGGIQVNPDNPLWQRDMMENVPFKNIVLEDGLPHHGHITLASYRWWTEFFLFHGWSRIRDLEEPCFDKFKETFRLYNWNPYILEKTVKLNELKTCIKTGASLGSGWYNYSEQEDFEGRWSDGLARIYFFEPEFEENTIRLILSAPEINYIQDWNVLITLENLVRTKAYKFKWVTHFSSSWHELSCRAQKISLDISFTQKNPKVMDDEVASDCWKINIISPTFCPAEYGTSPDSRRLGIVVHSLELLQN
jgi:2-polyprenyl-3-methyl-5-hydroxy-6-metoxy-1,4-benzoquinol methylase